ncbi:hypothetical protein VTN96DRAFT_6581 [Rasamsonia emersonii]
MTSMVLNGLGTSAYQAVIYSACIFDMFFVYDRGRMLSVYLFGQQLGSILGLITGGSIAIVSAGAGASTYIVAIIDADVLLLFFFTSNSRRRFSLAFCSSQHSPTALALRQTTRASRQPDHPLSTTTSRTSRTRRTLCGQIPRIMRRGLSTPSQREHTSKRSVCGCPTRRTRRRSGSTSVTVFPLVIPQRRYCKNTRLHNLVHTYQCLQSGFIFASAAPPASSPSPSTPYIPSPKS